MTTPQWTSNGSKAALTLLAEEFGGDEERAQRLIDSLYELRFEIVSVDEENENLETAARSDDDLRIQRALRRRIAKAVADKDCPAREVASLGKSLQSLTETIGMMQQKADQARKSGSKRGGKSGSSRASAAVGSGSDI